MCSMSLFTCVEVYNLALGLSAKRSIIFMGRTFVPKEGTSISQLNTVVGLPFGNFR